MKDYISQIQSFPLFSGIAPQELDTMLTCLGSCIRDYRRGEMIILLNESVKYIGIIITGTVHMVKEDVWGNKTILALMGNGEIFGETFSCGSLTTSSVAFSAASHCTVLFLPFYRVLHSCNLTCVFHHRLIENMVQMIAGKNAQLMEKIEIISRKSLREKILTYLSIQSQRQNSEYFEIPLGRSELAEYLCADRCALTRELASMKADGLLDYERNTFHLTA